MAFQYRVTLSGIKGFYRVYRMGESSTLYAFHKQMRADMEFPADQLILFKGLDADGNVVARYGLFDLGDGAADQVTVADFADVKAVDVTGTSKGTGFQGTIKRWNFSRGPMTHGSRNQRKPGSIGQCAYPARVRKGLHMAGHMGDERVTVKNLKLVRVDTDQNLLLVKGAVPGCKNALVQVRMA